MNAYTACHQRLRRRRPRSRWSRLFVVEAVAQEASTGGTPTVVGAKKKAEEKKEDIVVTDTQCKP